MKSADFVACNGDVAQVADGVKGDANGNGPYIWADRTRTTVGPVALLWKMLGADRWADVANGVLRQLRQTVGDGPVEEITAHFLGVGTK